MPVTRTFSAFTTITWSPVSRNGVYCGFSFPARMRATRDANRPKVCPEPSTTCHLRAISCPLGKRVTMSQTPENKTLKKDRSIDAAYYFLNGRHQAGYCRAVKFKGYLNQRTCVNAARIPPVTSVPLRNALVPRQATALSHRNFALAPRAIGAKLHLVKSHEDCRFSHACAQCALFNPGCRGRRLRNRFDLAIQGSGPDPAPSRAWRVAEIRFVGRTPPTR